MAADRPVADLAVAELPGSVQGIIAARLDGLPTDDKALLQDAAVVGKTFWLGAVAAIGGRDRADLERRLHDLERGRFVRRSRRSSVGGETEYVLHLLVRDVAYGQIPRAARGEKHRVAADWIGSLGRDRLEDRAELLAHHYGSALQLTRTAGLDATALEGPAGSRCGRRAIARPPWARTRPPSAHTRPRWTSGPRRSPAIGVAAPLRPDPLARPRCGIGGADRGEGRLPRVGPARRGGRGGTPDRRPDVAPGWARKHRPTSSER